VVYERRRFNYSRVVGQNSLVTGRRVYLRHPAESDEGEFLQAVRLGAKLHRPWVHPPSTPEAFQHFLERNRLDDFKALLVRTVDGDQLVGVFNLSQIFRRGFQSAYLGYWVSARFVRQGYMTEGLELVLDFAFKTHKLHRLEANIQPGNLASKALVRRCGFHREGFSPRYLKILGRWRDHERWALCREDRAECKKVRRAKRYV
jgi:[ribosomal protein S5]-alanine N-acetyltransferase